MSDTCLVFFKSNECNLDKAIIALQSYGFTVSSHSDKIIAYQDEELKFEIYIANGEYVQEEAIDIAKNSEFEEALSQCDARFEIYIEDLDSALDEINSLMEVQGALQDASKGYLFIPWNGKISEPWVG